MLVHRASAGQSAYWTMGGVLWAPAAAVVLRTLPSSLSAAALSLSSATRGPSSLGVGCLWLRSWCLSALGSLWSQRWIVGQSAGLCILPGPCLSCPRGTGWDLAEGASSPACARAQLASCLLPCHCCHFLLFLSRGFLCNPDCPELPLLYSRLLVCVHHHAHFLLSYFSWLLNKKH